MNNSFFVIENTRLELEDVVDTRPKLREREAELSKILLAIDGLEKTKHWSSLKELVFDGLAARLKTELYTEAVKQNPDLAKLSRLAGRLDYTETYDLEKFKKAVRTELTSIKNQLYGSTQKD